MIFNRGMETTKHIMKNKRSFYYLYASDLYVTGEPLARSPPRKRPESRNALRTSAGIFAATLSIFSLGKSNPNRDYLQVIYFNSLMLHLLQISRLQLL